MSLRKIPPRRRTDRHEKPEGDLPYAHIAERALFEVGLTWRHVLWYRESLNGRVSLRGRICAPAPRTLYAVYVLLHELGHFHLHVDVRPDGKLQLRQGKAHVHEYQAETWAIAWFKSHAIELPAWIIDAAKRYVAGHIRRDVARGIEIERHVAAWAGVDPGSLTHKPPKRPRTPASQIAPARIDLYPRLPEPGQSPWTDALAAALGGMFSAEPTTAPASEPPPPRRPPLCYVEPPAPSAAAPAASPLRAPERFAPQPIVVLDLSSSTTTEVRPRIAQQLYGLAAVASVFLLRSCLFLVALPFGVLVAAFCVAELLTVIGLVELALGVKKSKAMADAIQLKVAIFNGDLLSYAWTGLRRMLGY